MSKSTRMSPEDLEAMGLEEDKDGNYKPKSKGIRQENIDKVMGKWLNTPLPEDVLQTFIEQGVVYADSIGNKSRPYDILKLRTLTGKARKEMLASIEIDCRAFLKSVGKQSIYIQGNVPSSKNSKSIGVYKKRNVQGELETKHTLMNSKTTQRYEKESRLAWHQNKDIFLDLVRNKPFPLMVEFTFIRESVRAFDLHNAVQYPCDLMTDNGWIPDDESAYIVPVFNPVVYYSKTLAGVIIRVL